MVAVVIAAIPPVPPLGSKVYVVYSEFISYTQPVSETIAPPVWTLPPPPARQRSLGREEIVAAAIRLADATGSGALTMQAVAASLGSYSAMALYRYVHSKDGLFDLMLDAVTAEVALPDRPDLTWRARLHELAVATRQMTKRHPWYPELFHTRPPART